MKQQSSGAVQYWDYVAPVVKYPKNNKELNELISVLDGLLEIIGNDEKYHLIGLLDVISGLISSYEEDFSTPPVKGVDALRFLMENHGLRQADLSEIGSQGVVSEILQGKRMLNLRQARLLAKRFYVDISTFVDS